MRWTPISDKKPPKYGKYLVSYYDRYNKDKKLICIAEWWHFNNFFANEFGIVENVEAWMKQPKPYCNHIFIYLKRRKNHGK